jgi:membrane-bound serine protease (ClpP class)
MGASLALGAPAATATGGDDPARVIRVVQVRGLLDPPNASLVRDTIRAANDEGATLLFIQIDSPGALDVDVGSMVQAIERSRVPVVVWVGPPGSEARGAAALLFEAAHFAFLSPGSSVGPAGPLRLDASGPPRAVLERELARLAEDRGRNPSGAMRLVDERLTGRRAGLLGVTNGRRPTLGEVIVTLDGQSVRTTSGTVELSTARVVGEGVERRRQPNQPVVFESAGVGAQIQHSLLNPRIAYFLLVVGLALIAFEFFAASIGFASVVGAVCLVGACYGLSHLPVHWWAALLLGIAIAGFSIDVQAGGVGAWTMIGSAALIGGSVTLFGGNSRLDVPWWEVLVMVVSLVLFFLGAMPAFVRGRFSTPTVGREPMIGLMGTAEVGIDPDGVVVVRGARWRARTNRATPIAAGDPVRVVSVEGLLLEVEPEHGGARDHRDRARRRRTSDADTTTPES